MRLTWALAATLFQHYVQAASFLPAKRHYSTHDYYVLEHDPAGGASLHDCAGALGLNVVEQAGELRNHWILRSEKSAAALNEATLDKLAAIRMKSQFPQRSSEVHDARKLAHSIKELSFQVLRKRSKRAPPPITPGSSTADVNMTTARSIAEHFSIVDPLFTQQWHLVNDEYPGQMMNVAPVWDMGITGEGIIATMVDDGLDYNSDDLAENFDAVDSYDFNDHVPLPTPVLFDDHHGTRCAGQIAAVKNDVCGMGIAYGSKVAGVRILSGPISDVDEAAALNYGFQNSSIYSCSWGPPDDGRSMEAPSRLIQKAVVNGIQNGRGGKGSIFVFASGNGAASGDQCNFDGYTNSIYSVTVAAVDNKGLHPYYSEACAANMVVAYSSGGGKNIVTTDVGKNKCSTSHGGTSAAAPNAVGVFALALSVRPDLSWRDIQHLCVHTAKKINPDDPDWEDTAAGGRYSYKYGYGVLDAYEFVKAAQDWKTVPPQAWLSTPVTVLNNGSMNIFKEMSGGELIIPGGIKSVTTVTKEMMTENNFGLLEHITVKVWISHTMRGDVEVELVSPYGIKSVLAGKRQFDRDANGFPGWTFMTIKHWDEDPVGDWTIRVSDQEKEGASGYFLGWTMTFWGMTIDPSKAETYVVAAIDDIFPPPAPEDIPAQPSSTIVETTSTKIYVKPTNHLPENHTDAEGEANKPAFPSGGQSQDDTDISQPVESTPAETMTPTPDEGWFSDMSNLVSDQKWVFGAIAAVMLFGLSAGAYFFWRRRAAWQKRRNYGPVSVSDNDVHMTSIGGGGGSHVVGRSGPRTKELYDAFGEVSEDEDDADEETGLAGRPRGLSPGVVGYHSGFLDDDEPPSAPLYKDEPDEAERLTEGETRNVNGSSRASPTGSGSGDGSWEHASQTR